MSKTLKAPHATLIDILKNRVLEGREIAESDALELIELEDARDIDYLQRAAHEITQRFTSPEPGLCSLINAKSNLCGEDCAFCSQSVRFETKVDAYDLMPIEEIVRIAKKFEKNGTKNLCLVTSGGALSDEEFERTLEIYRTLRKETSLNLDGSLGFLTPERVERLKEAGIRRYNDNLQTSPNYYSEIVSTHTYETRKKTLRALQEHDVEICSGGILGMGESREDRVKLAFELKPFEPQCLPMNILNPRPGTPLEKTPAPESLEMVKTIAVFRFVHPGANIKLAGGREVHLSREEQTKSLMGGANGLIVGGYLTTKGGAVNEDMEMLKRAGYQPNNPAQSETSPASS